MKRLFLLLALLLFIIIAFVSQANSQTKISGTVTGEESKPLYGANVVLEGTIDGATTDEKGLYEFETDKTGRFNLIVTYVGYAEKIVIVDLAPGQNVVKDIKLGKSEIETEEIIVTASSFTSGENSRVTLTPLEIVRIPGADADLYRAITTFPGSNQVDEGSRITVRGGDPDEVITILDQATLYNPFIFDDSYNTSSYSTVNPWSLRGINFTSGGFSAKFGNALSAVLDLKSYEMTRGTGMFALLGVGAGSLAGVWTANDGKLGATFQVDQTYLKPFFDLNGITAEYSKVPEARGFGGTIAKQFSKTGYAKLYFSYSGDQLGILSNSPSFDGFYTTKSHNYFTNLKVSFAPTSASSLSIGASFSHFDRNQAYGLLDSKSKDYYAKLRADFTNPVTEKIEFNAGAEIEYNKNDLNGIFPENGYNIRPGAPSINLNLTENTKRIGGYAEGLFKVTKKFFAITGVRSDYHTLSKKVSFDPRLSVGYQFNNYNALRGAVGIYHQYPRVDEYERSFDNDLDAQEAMHYILGYEFNKDNEIIFRVEGYYKDYKKLPSTYAPLYFGQPPTYASTGSGFAKGIDVFLKGKFENKFTGWISYAYSDSKRRRFDSDALVSATYDITHNLTVVGSYNITDRWTAGVSYRISTGKPYTPVVGSYYDFVEDVYVPIYAETNSGRFPTYQRVDLNVQYLTSLFDKFAVFFVALNNLLDTKNLYLITYNQDYSQKIEVRSNNKRIVYFGVGIQL
ncbi:MAG TPA: TonB-dependent receptor [Ignavibacteria bacterium]|nr:TonB-dependent receptor [Ignavibacteria bacterium]